MIELMMNDVNNLSRKRMCGYIHLLWEPKRMDRLLLFVCAVYVGWQLLPSGPQRYVASWDFVV